VARVALFKVLEKTLGKEAARQYAASARGVGVAHVDRARSEHVNPWTTPGFWSGVAPRVFSGGGSNCTLANERRIREGKRLEAFVWLEHVIWANTNRFAQHRTLPLLGARLLMQEQARGQACYGIHQPISEIALTKDQLREQMERGDERIFSMLFALEGNATGSAGYWHKFNREAKAGLVDACYLEQENQEALPPTLVFTSKSCGAH
jgi:hypothetical protein